MLPARRFFSCIHMGRRWCPPHPRSRPPVRCWPAGPLLFSQSVSPGSGHIMTQWFIRITREEGTPPIGVIYTRDRSTLLFEMADFVPVIFLNHKNQRAEKNTGKICSFVYWFFCLFDRFLFILNNNNCQIFSFSTGKLRFFFLLIDWFTVYIDERLYKETLYNTFI